MRVALLSYNARAHDAIGNHVAETAAFFADRGAAVRVFVESMDRLHPALHELARVVDRVEPSGPVWDDLADADLVITQFAQSCKVLNFLPLLAGGKPRLLIDYHGVTPPDLWSGPHRELLERGQQQRGLIWCVDAAIAHSEYTRRELITATGFPGERIHRLPLVVDHARFRPERARWLHQRLGLDNAKLLLYVGRVAPNKRVSLLVEALPQLPAHVHVVVIGDISDIYAAEAERCRHRARELHVANRVHLLGQLDEPDLAAAYRSADTLVIPSRHEGFCVPVIEAMASGLPVIAARSTALPETVGDAGLTFAADDAADLARQVERVLDSGLTVPPLPCADRRRHIAVVCFRFGADIVGGAETSLRALALALHEAGHRVEAFTTCTRSESEWRNELPSGTMVCDGLIVHRFPIDPHDREAHIDSVRAVVEAEGQVDPDAEARYLAHSIHSQGLLAALQQRAGTLNAIIVGPYLFGLTHDVARAYPELTLLVPCFHDEPIARLAAWPAVYGSVGGMLLHSPEEKALALARLGINVPNAVEVGTWIPTSDRVEATIDPQMPWANYIVYCGRYSAQKNLPLVLDWMRRFQQRRPGCCSLVCMGQGEVLLPREPWLYDLGRVSEDRKRALLAGARALVQLSQQESLSIVALEAWAEGTPVIVHAGCAVLAGQVERSQGGVAVTDFDAFAQALDEMLDQPNTAETRGRNGLAYVRQHYASRAAYRVRLEEAIANLDLPLAERMRQRGLERARSCARAAWRDALGRIVDDLLDGEARPYRPCVIIEPLHGEIHAPAGTATTLIAARVHNRGTHAVVADGPGRTVLSAEVTDPRSATILAQADTELPGLLVPGASQTAMLLVPVPTDPGTFALHLRATGSEPMRVQLHVGHETTGCGLAPLLDEVRAVLAQAMQRRRLPDDFVDVTEGWFARAKRWVKRKLLYNFKHAYVDVLSRQQSQLNDQLIAAVQQLAECCASLDHTVRTLQRSPTTPLNMVERNPVAQAVHDVE
jgi:glycosyltransferase involved in cell wall biosynthesis